MSGFTFNGDYTDHEQVREFLPAFRELREGMRERGEFPYNDAFLGLIPGLAGTDEGRAIYLLQGLARIEAEAVEVAQLRAEGFRELSDLDETRRYPRVVVWREGYYVGGSGRLDRFEDARVVPREGRPFAILPKGKRTRGHGVGSGVVLVHEAAR
jgi:hypothetical protein